MVVDHHLLCSANFYLTSHIGSTCTSLHCILHLLIFIYHIQHHCFDHLVI